jgi:citrate synthase
MILDKEQKIARPRQVYAGYGERQYPSLVHEQYPHARKDSIHK